MIYDLSDIILDLSKYDGHLYCEKLLEAWFMENMYTLSTQYNDLINLFGEFDYYANSIYTYYTNFLDVIAYNIEEDYELKRCGTCNGILRDFARDIRVIELKRDYVADVLSISKQIKGYMKWAKEVLNPESRVTGYIVAARFKNIETHDDNIKLIKYSICEDGLKLQKLNF